jgi:TolB-like protein/Tfp pilus assembly protein PilF
VTSSLQINVLGRFEARSTSGEVVDFNSKKAVALLGYLAVEARHAHAREELANLLWSRMGDERARHNLRQALVKIRACSDSLLIASGESLAIDQQSCSVDVIEFERLSRAEEPEALGRCLELYAGDLLEGLTLREAAFEEWLIPTRARLRQTACNTADKLVELLIAADRTEEAVKTLHHRLVMDPACEPAHADLMKLFVRLGRRSDALRQYQTCVESLRRELAAEPSAETRSLYASIQRMEAGSEVTHDAHGAAVAAPVTHERPTIAVLPFDNLSGDQDAYFVDGIVEDLITALSRFSTLVVSARGSSFRYRDEAISDRQVADELGAQFLVRGSMQRAGNRVRINVQLLDTVSETHVWAGRFDRELEDVFAVQDEITSTLVSILAGQVEAARLANIRKASPERLDAYDILLRGKDHHHRFTAEDCSACIDLFERAIDKDPNYALAHTWLACGLGQAMVFKPEEKNELIDRSEAAARRGLELDENESECHRILAQICLTRGNLKRALWHQERALFLNPNDDRSVCSMGEILSYLGRHQEAEQWVRNSMKLNPYHPQRYWTHLARPLFHLGRYQEALEALDRVGRLRADDHAYRVASLARIGDADICKMAVADLLKEVPDFNVDEFAESLPYDQARDRQTLVDALMLVNLGQARDDPAAMHQS